MRFNVEALLSRVAEPDEPFELFEGTPPVLEPMQIEDALRDMLLPEESGG